MDLGISISSTIILSSEQKRKRDKGFIDSNNRKRSKSGERSNVVDVEITTDTKKHKLDTTDLYSIQEAKPNSLVGYKSKTYSNQIYCYLVVFLAD